MTDQERRAREAVRRVLPGIKRSLSKEGSQQFFRSHLQVEDVERLIGAASEGNADALEILREYARGARRAGMFVPDALHAFAWEYFIDGPPKAPPGSKPQDNLLRNMLIVSLVKVVSEEFGIPVYRNVEHRGAEDGPICALKLVGEELGLRERGVEEIWEARPR
jgi:hypothetical protein